MPGSAVLAALSLLCHAGGLRIPEEGRGSPAEESAELQHDGPSSYVSWHIWEGRMSEMPGYCRMPEHCGSSEDFVPDPQDAFVKNGKPCLLPSDLRQSDAYRLWNVSTPALTPFLVPKDQPNRMDVSMVIVPGGGMRDIAWESEGVDVARWLNSVGVSAFVLRYRVPGEAWDTSSQAMDVQRSIAYIRSAADRLDLNASRIGLFGAGYGGKLAMLASSRVEPFYELDDDEDPASLRPNFNILLYPHRALALIGSQISGSPYQGMHNSTLVPPTLIAAAADDSCNDYTDVIKLFDFLSPMRDMKELHLFPTGGHAFGLCYRRGREYMEREDVCTWPERAEAFLQRRVLQQPKKESQELFSKMRKMASRPRPSAA